MVCRGLHGWAGWDQKCAYNFPGLGVLTLRTNPSCSSSCSWQFPTMWLSLSALVFSIEAWARFKLVPYSTINKHALSCSPQSSLRRRPANASHSCADDGRKEPRRWCFNGVHLIQGAWPNIWPRHHNHRVRSRNGQDSRSTTGRGAGSYWLQRQLLPNSLGRGGAGLQGGRGRAITR